MPALSTRHAVRCAIYTRKSVKHGLDPEQSSLQMQRDICSAYIKSQRHRRWMENSTHYDDAGFSGGSLVRPALRQLIADVEQGLVDVIVIYKLDRLTRSLADFMRLIDVLEANGVTFVSVTQSFDTQDTMGRLILNVLLTFAQFEREMIADRVRDKMMEMKRAGRWTGGAPPYGYDLVKGRLVINELEAAEVRVIFERYLQVHSANALTEEVRARGLRAKAWITREGKSSGGGIATRGLIYGLLGNPVYVGEFHVRGDVFAGVHEPIIDRALWEQVQSQRDARKLKQPLARPQDNLLLGFTFDDLGRQMRIDAGEKTKRFYRYYFSDRNHAATKRGLKVLRAGADDLEKLVLTGICTFLRDRFALSGAVAAIAQRDKDTERLIDRGPNAANLIERFDRRRLRFAWEALIDRIELSREKVRIILRAEQLVRLLAWQGSGAFRDRTSVSTKPYTIHVLEFDAMAVRRERTFKLRTDPIAGRGGKPNKKLVQLMQMAREVQGAIYERRDQTLEQLAIEMKRKPAFVARVLRLNYLAPDIIAAIMDGRQPPTLDRRMLVYSSLPTDWAQQRAMLGFASQWDPSPRDEHY